MRPVEVCENRGAQKTIINRLKTSAHEYFAARDGNFIAASPFPTQIERETSGALLCGDNFGEK
jgi:hypothetical protein